MASDYAKAMIRMETWLNENPTDPTVHEARAMLVLTYHNDETRKNQFQREVDRIRQNGRPGVIAVLKLMENPTTASRLGNAIRDVLVSIGEPSIKPLMEVMKGNNWRLRQSAQRTLIQLGPLAVPALIEALDDPDVYTRSMSIDALSKIGDKRAIEPLKEKLNDPNKMLQIEAAAALDKMGESVPTNIIVDGMDDPNLEVRRAATKATWEIVDKPPINVVLKAMKDEDAQVRNYAVLSASKTGSAEVIKPLVKVLKTDQDDQVKNSSAKALEKFGSPAVNDLIAILNNKSDIELTIRVVQVLGNIGDRRAIKPMEKVYEEANNPLLKNETAKALNKID
ncbi:hypothetical protein GF312_00660 [Candidatus Poribacteria bacterium]|nr:hypothetical protein [Candidatus Poribacteria bacterium]